LTQRLSLIYPDTIIWNLLCDQNIDPGKLLDSLRAKGFALVISFHTIYEFARNFEREDAAGNARGRQLFSCLKPSMPPSMGSRFFRLYLPKLSMAAASLS